jgi:type II secretory pathway component GspD/PulD (secretin)
LLGRLFRRETETKEKVDLLIFIKASIIESEQYADRSARVAKAREAAMELELLENGMVGQQAEADEGADASDADNEEILALVEQMDGGGSAKNAPAE